MSEMGFDIEFFKTNELPDTLQKEAKKQGLQFSKKIIAVMIRFSPFRIEFRELGNNPEEYITLLNDLALEDGVDLAEAFNKNVGE